MTTQHTLSEQLIGIVKAYENDHPQGSDVYEAANILNTVAILLETGQVDRIRQISFVCDQHLA